ncbi:MULTISPECIES: 4Fe-4S dicluster domain-containing protein [Desulfosporosinus]|uniref:Electron transport complex subunit RsxB n=1 Tax=Desulfosporosinus acididurans TaxID=476652 RepID=A0A0J1FRR7_9FIRM|nr:MULTISPECIES: 4Fe-4S dicluster domain-containing protein [Desulfosporosinus]KLU66175.1 electron transport complex subunit RsxB [Desulfosporosinus acididurans]
MSAFILEKLCRGCKRCVNTCPEQAIAMLSHLAVVDPKKCVECEACMEACMHGAITFVDVGEMNANGG